ncbi:hypothetical protein V1525DRAFT_408396 [Lipomyces kononenkoae]|uniref:Uncharacterized protein n=1 Tax=Lipomyces kononenkoae TaxID=34357 RepID=A0ACC3SWG5_LIPKO
MPLRDAKRRRLVFDDFGAGGRDFSTSTLSHVAPGQPVRYRHNTTPSSPSSSSAAAVVGSPYTVLNQQSTQFSLEFERQKASFRLKQAWDDICRRYGRDFGNETDVVDIMTGEIIEDHGHLSNMGGAGPADVWRPKRRYRKRNKNGSLQVYGDVDDDERQDLSDYEDVYDVEDLVQDVSDDDDDGQEYATDQSDELLSAPATSTLYSSSPLKHSPAAAARSSSSRASYSLVSSPPPHAPARASPPPSPPQSSSLTSDYEDSENLRSKKVHDLDLLIQSWANETRAKDDTPVSGVHADEGDVPVRHSALATHDHKPSTHLSKQPLETPSSVGPPHTTKQEHEVVAPSSPVLECGTPGYHCGRNFCFSCM